MMWRVARRAGVLLALLVVVGSARADELGMLKVGVLKFGTVNWELDVIKAHGLDRNEGFTLEVQPFAGNDAADVALMGDAVDAIVEDWLFVSRQRAAGVPLAFIPYSSSVGAVMVPQDAGIATLADLEGKRLGVAGGPLDKGWLMLQAYGRAHAGMDLKKAVEVVFAAPPLLNEKVKSGELDAVLNYWHFGARLEAEGFRRLISVADAQAALGVPATVPQLGYVFKEGWADERPGLVAAFARASRAAKAVMKESDAEWRRLMPLTRAESGEVLDAFMRRYREGIVDRWGERERQDAARLFTELAKLGGEPLVGTGATLAPGTFWAQVSY